jgi:hypothetical protein
MSEALLDDDGENLAVRAFLLGRDLGFKSVEDLRSHMRLSGFDQYWPEWATQQSGHLSKAGAQAWIRYLLGLETAGNESELDRLRTEVASIKEEHEKASLDTCGYVRVKASAIDWLKENYPALCEKSGLCESVGKRLYTITSLPLTDTNVKMLTQQLATLKEQSAKLEAVRNDWKVEAENYKAKYCGLLEQNAQGQEVVLYMARNLHSNSYATSHSKAEAELFLMQSGLKNDGIEAEVIPLCALTAHTQQVKSEDARDAARYRWLRDGAYSWDASFPLEYPDSLDEIVDAAISAQEEKGLS